jgi:hypothetical protein
MEQQSFGYALVLLLKDDSPVQPAAFILFFYFFIYKFSLRRFPSYAFLARSA